MLHRQKRNSLRARSSLLLTIAACVAGLFPARVSASAENQIEQAVTASRAWVAQIDAGKYDDSYNFTCGETRDRFPQDRWVAVLKAIRTQWGGVISRTQLSHIYKPNGVPGLDGECEVITYATNFKNLSNAQETVVLKWEDGQWRGAGYRAGPITDPDATASTSPASGTEIHTEEHVKPQPQSP